LQLSATAIVGVAPVNVAWKDPTREGQLKYPRDLEENQAFKPLVGNELPPGNVVVVLVVVEVVVVVDVVDVEVVDVVDDVVVVTFVEVVIVVVVVAVVVVRVVVVVVVVIVVATTALAETRLDPPARNEA